MVNHTFNFYNETFIDGHSGDTHFWSNIYIGIAISSLLILIIFIILAVFVLKRKIKKRRLLNQDNKNKLLLHQKNQDNIKNNIPFEECQLIKEETESSKTFPTLLKEDQYKFNSSRPKRSTKLYSNIARQKPDALLLSLSSQLPDYDSLFDSSSVLDQLSNNQITIHSHIPSENKVQLRTPPTISESFTLSNKILSSKTIQGGNYFQAARRNNKVKDLIGLEINQKYVGVKTEPATVGHEYDPVYVPHSCASSMDKRLDGETSYIRSTWKKRRSILYEEITDVVRRISARLRPDSSHRQSNYSCSSNRASHNLDAPNRQSSDNNNNMTHISDHIPYTLTKPVVVTHNNKNIANKYSEDIPVNSNCATNKYRQNIIKDNVDIDNKNSERMNCTKGSVSDSTAPEVPKHCGLPIAPLRVASNIKNNK